MLLLAVSWRNLRAENVAPLTDAPAPTLGYMDWSGVATKSKAAMVQFEIDRGSAVAVGSGVIVDVDADTGEAFVLTNFHVVRDAYQLIAITSSGQRYLPEIIGWHNRTDLALFRICCDTTLGSASLATTDLPLPGSPVLAVGYPIADATTPTFSGGIVAALRTHKDSGRDEIQIDAAINSGNSGGALLDPRGCLLGINTYMVSEIDGSFVGGIGFAIGHTTVQDFLEKHLASGSEAAAKGC